MLDGRPVAAREITGLHGNRIHKFDAHAGHLEVRYEASIVGQTSPAPVSDYDTSMYLWPSRYAEADKLFGFASTEFGAHADSVTLLEKVSSWVGTQLNYLPGSSDPIDGAVDTLLAGKGGVQGLRASRRRTATRGRCACAPNLRVCARPVTDGLP